MELDPQAFANMLVEGTVAGGFLGFLQGLEGGSVSRDFYAKYLYSESYTKAIPPPPTCTKPSATKGIFAALGSIFGTIMSVGLMAAFGTLTAGAGAIIGLGLVGAGSAALTGYQAGSGTC
jgi:hypothetical protein